ncbi:MAG: lipocalin family protein [Flavipsychrobacter sp.]
MSISIVNKNIYLLLGLVAVLLSSCTMKDLKTVKYVDVEQYLGKWYEIASFPQSFQKGCSCTTAEYSMNDNGSLKVINSCNVEGKRKTVTGKAFVKDKKSNAKLAVQFFWPFRGKYWIIELADNYSYAVVGHPNRKYLWILSRTPEMDKELYEQLLQKVSAKGFDTNKLVVTDQSCWK